MTTQRSRYERFRADGTSEQLVVRDRAGTPRGQIVALVLDLAEGRPAFAIVGGTGLLETHRPVPWWFLDPDVATGFVADIDDDGWARAPQLPPEAPIDWHDASVHRRYCGFYEQLGRRNAHARRAAPGGETAEETSGNG